MAVVGSPEGEVVVGTDSELDSRKPVRASVYVDWSTYLFEILGPAS